VYRALSAEELAKSTQNWPGAQEASFPAGPRHVQNGGQLKHLYRWHDKPALLLVASRAAVGRRLRTNDMQVGQTGKIVASETCISAVGISGAISTGGL